MQDRNGKPPSLPPLEFEERKPHRGRRIAAWSALLALLGGGAWAVHRYSQPGWQTYHTWLAKMPVMQESLDSVGRRVEAAEARLRASSDDQEGLGERMKKIEGQVSRNLNVARRQAQEIAAQTYQRMAAELARHSQAMTAMNERVERIESGQESEGARLARLQEEIAGLRREVRQELTQQLAQAKQETSQQVAGLTDRVSNDRRQIDTLNERLERRRVDFEVTKNHSQELAPGISLSVTRTNVSYRKVDGWLWVLPDRRTIWVRGQNSQQPVRFYSKQDSRPYELVFTHVGKKSAVGYLLVPGRTPGRDAAAGE